MPLVTLANAMSFAEKNKIAIGAFNIANYESCKAVFDGAEELGMPVIIQIFHRLFNDDKARDMAEMVKSMAKRVKIPVVLHLDHGRTILQVRQAIEYGFTSVMIDGSELPLQDNINLTKEVVSIAKGSNVSVEAELGHVLPKDSNEKASFLTLPEDTKSFVEQTSVDALAIAIGTAHGHYKGTPKLDLERLKKIHSIVDVPLVLHGGSYTPEGDVSKTISYGIRKVNIATELHQVYIDEIALQSAKYKDKFTAIDIYMQPVYEKMKELVMHKINVFTFK